MVRKFLDWYNSVFALKSSVDKDLQEIRKCKAEMQQMRKELVELINSGRYIRDDQRLILSAPEIIIGNVDPMGVLYNDANSKIVLRGTDVGLQASGEYGQVEVRASSIREVAEDPGVDGFEHFVDDKSEIVSQARNIVIQSNDEVEAFSKAAKPENLSGICILSDSALDIRALNGLETKKNDVSDAKESLTSRKGQLEDDAEVHEKSFINLYEEMGRLRDEKAEFLKEKDNVRLNYNKLDWLNAQLDATMKSFAEEANSYGNILAELAETNRQINVMEQLSSELDDSDPDDGFASITISSERVDFIIEDGDRHPCDKPQDGINMSANKIKLDAYGDNGELCGFAREIKLATPVLKDIEIDKNHKEKCTIENEGNIKILSKNILLESVDYKKDGNIYTEKQLTPESRIALRSQTIDLSTMNVANMEVDENGNISKANYTTEGDIIVCSKTLSVVSADYDIENGEVKEKSLTKDSQLFIRTEKTELSATETDGKATGSVSINAKNIAVKSMNVKEDDRSDDTIAYEGTMSLITNKINLFTSESIQLQSPKVGLFADETFEAQQGDGGSVLQLSDGNVAVGAKMTQVYGDTEVRGELKTPKATIDNQEVKASFKSPNISDGMAAPVPSAGKLNTKLKKDEFADIKEAQDELRTEVVSRDISDSSDSTECGDRIDSNDSKCMCMLDDFYKKLSLKIKMSPIEPDSENDWADNDNDDWA